jgi:20S proteasome subunit alpha 6
MLRHESLQHKFIKGTEPEVSELADIVAERSQNKTQKYGKRPFGVGILLIGAGPGGAGLYETCPSGQHWEYLAQAIGRRAQAAKAYLEQHLAEFEKAGRDELIRHALKALGDCRSKDETGLECVALGIVGVEEPFELIEGEKLRPFVE